MRGWPLPCLTAQNPVTEGISELMQPPQLGSIRRMQDLSAGAVACWAPDPSCGTSPWCTRASRASRRTHLISSCRLFGCVVSRSLEARVRTGAGSEAFEHRSTEGRACLRERCADSAQPVRRHAVRWSQQSVSVYVCGMDTFVTLGPLTWAGWRNGTKDTALWTSA